MKEFSWELFPDILSVSSFFPLSGLVVPAKALTPVFVSINFELLGEAIAVREVLFSFLRL